MGAKNMMTTFVCLAMLIKLAMAATYTVGGPNGGWDSTTDLQTWASSQPFSVGDTLIFKYTPNHDVSEVSKSDYDNCLASNTIQTRTDGNTAIKLSSPGKRYFICGTPGHCSQGMKLQVDTLATTSASPAPSPSIQPTASPTPLVSAPAPIESPLSAPAISPPMPSTEAPLPSVETPSSTPIPSGLSPTQPPPSSANKCGFSFTLASGLAMMMFFTL